MIYFHVSFFRLLIYYRTLIHSHNHRKISCTWIIFSHINRLWSSYCEVIWRRLTVMRRNKYTSANCWFVRLMWTDTRYSRYAIQRLCEKDFISLVACSDHVTRNDDGWRWKQSVHHRWKVLNSVPWSPGVTVSIVNECNVTHAPWIEIDHSRLTNVTNASAVQVSSTVN